MDYYQVFKQIAVGFFFLLGSGFLLYVALDFFVVQYERVGKKVYFYLFSIFPALYTCWLIGKEFLE